jgi:uncharacterized lipoprotein YehR (DUF1307 family)
MKTTLRITLFACFYFLSLLVVSAQDDSPVAYMNLLEKAEQDANQKYLAYISAAAHSGRVRKIEKMRQQLLNGIINSRNNVIGTPFYKGDKALRQSSIDYLNFLYLVFNDDYAKMVNMEEIAEQSFNEMQAYLLLQEKAGEKLNEIQTKRNTATKDFAKKYNVTLLEGNSEMGDKMKKASDVIKYRNEVYLVFFKCNWQWNELNKAIKNNKINDIEQARNAVIAFAEEGMKALDTLKHFEGDPSLANSCRTALIQYKRMAEKDVPKLTDFILKSENFEKLKKSFDAKPAKDRTQQDINNYNKAVNELNKGVNLYNNTNQILVDTNNELIRSWEKTDKDFSDAHTPYFKK